MRYQIPANHADLLNVILHVFYSLWSLAERGLSSQCEHCCSVGDTAPTLIPISSESGRSWGFLFTLLFYASILYILCLYEIHTHSYTHYLLVYGPLICRIVHDTSSLSLAKFKNTQSEINSVAVIHFTNTQKWRSQLQTHTKAYSTAKQSRRSRNRSGGTEGD